MASSPGRACAISRPATTCAPCDAAITLFFYHSNTGKEIVGIVEVVKEAYPDPTADSGDWVCVDMRAVAPIPQPVTLAAIKADPKLAGFELIRLSRLSVVPVSAEHWRHICGLGGYQVPGKASMKTRRPA